MSLQMAASAEPSQVRHPVVVPVPVQVMHVPGARLGAERAGPSRDDPPGVVVARVRLETRCRARPGVEVPRHAVRVAELPTLEDPEVLEPPVVALPRQQQATLAAEVRRRLLGLWHLSPRLPALDDGPAIGPSLKALALGRGQAADRPRWLGWLRRWRGCGSRRWPIRGRWLLGALFGQRTEGRLQLPRQLPPPLGSPSQDADRSACRQRVPWRRGGQQHVRQGRRDRFALPR